MPPRPSVFLFFVLEILLAIRRRKKREIQASPKRSGQSVAYSSLAVRVAQPWYLHTLFGKRAMVSSVFPVTSTVVTALSLRRSFHGRGLPASAIACLFRSSTPSSRGFVISISIAPDRFNSVL